MSRIGKQPIVIPPKVKVNVEGQKVSVEGPKGKLKMELHRRTTLKVEGDKIGAAGEFAAVAYIASLTGYSMDRVAQLFILAISCLPDLLAITLLIAAGHSASHGGAREGAGRPRNQANLKSKPVRKAKLRRTGKPANLKVVNAQP